MSTFLNDTDVAAELCLSRSWVRKQRWLRRHRMEHVLELDPVMIGSAPRYRKDEFQAWMKGLQAAA